MANLALGCLIFGVFGGLSGAGLLRILKRSGNIPMALVLGPVFSLLIITLAVFQSSTHAPFAVLAVRLWPAFVISACIAFLRTRAFARYDERLAADRAARAAAEQTANKTDEKK
ncbi:MAG TPA: hypothetical protein V6C81_11590 [Planktothrix sp.]|jgi:hypothetical protein